MPASVDKVIVTNLTALKAKYGKEVAQIEAAVKDLIAADQKRGVTTRRVDLDNATDMKKLGARAVKDAEDPKQNKTAVDGVFTALQPDYLLLLGAVDVIPHQDLANPAYDVDNDVDQTADSDLPYACEQPYSTNIKDFTGPTRVAGRLPDVTGGPDPAYLVGLLKAAAGWQPLQRSQYAVPFGISAGIWEQSTKLSLDAVFGSAAGLGVVPPDGPPWKAADLAKRSHFVNCHGAQADWRFYGQPAGVDDYPEALNATQLAGRITAGTVLAAECCYGAELYDPAGAGGNLGMCNTYLGNGACGYFGSSTIAYGPEDSNDWADLLCQYFWNHVLTGASLGRAALQARQDYVASHAVLGPVDLKTLAQFSLMADPAVQALQVAADHVVGKGKAVNPGAGRELRRGRLARVGLALAEAVPAVAAPTKAPAKGVRDRLRAALPQAGFGEPSFRSFQLEAPKRAGYTKGRAAKALAAAPEVEAVHIALARRPKQEVPIAAPQLAVVVAIEQGGQLIIKQGLSR
jgi:hypothetical protein